jgi:hypothetical protein
MLAKERVWEAFRKLGDNANWNEVNDWLKKNYGFNSTVSDGTFYSARKEYRAKQAASAKLQQTQVIEEDDDDGEEDFQGNMATTEVKPTGLLVQNAENKEPEVEKEITLADAQEVLIFANKIGGRDRLRIILDGLDKLFS